MPRKHVTPDHLDTALARMISRHANGRAERLGEGVTRLGDEKLLLAIVGLACAGARLRNRKNASQWREALASVIVTSLADHLSKHLFSEKRPDRVHPAFLKAGVHRAGKRTDAFPSGHAMHMGALASALSRIYPEASPYIWVAGAGVTATRVLLLAHWLSDAIIGFSCGVALDRITHRILNRS